MTYVGSLDTIKCRFDFESFPSYFEIIWQYLFCLVVNDTLFYWSHRMLHHPAIYSKVHKIHHEYVNSIALCAEYAHPFEYIFGNVIPSAAGFTILGTRTHLATIIFW